MSQQQDEKEWQLVVRSMQGDLILEHTFHEEPSLDADVPGYLRWQGDGVEVMAPAGMTVAKLTERG